MSVHSELEQRVFAPETQEVQRIAASATPVTALCEAIRAWQDQASAHNAAMDRLERLWLDATPTERTALLVAWLRQNTPWSRLLGDLIAVRRDLSIEAIRERHTARTDRLGSLCAMACAQLATDIAREPEALERACRTAHALLGHSRPQTRRLAARTLNHLLRDADPQPWCHHLCAALEHAAHDDDNIWVRRAAARVVLRRDPLDAMHRARAFATSPIVAEGLVSGLAKGGCWALLSEWLDHSSELVRFAVIEAAVQHERPELYVRAVGSKRARARAKAASLLERAEHQNVLAHLVADIDDTVSLQALVTATRVAEQHELTPALYGAIRSRLTADTQRRRWAERALSWHRFHGLAARDIAADLRNLPEHANRRVTLPQGITALDLAEALQPLAMDGFNYTLRARGQRVTVFRGDTLVEQAWRAAHELRRPAPAKRQGHSHTVGPALLGNIFIPTFVLAEQSATGVPGQRVQVDGEDWGPEVPTLDDYRRALKFGTSYRVTAQGIRTIGAPATRAGRLRAGLNLMWHAEAHDRARHAAVEQHKPQRFTQRLEALGFTHRASGVPLWSYVLSTQGNTLTHLALVVALLWTLLLGSNLWLRSRILAHRRSLSLVVGGWGTRGKSGTERIKAGMLKGAGAPFVSKTTGCEAMILHGPRGGRVHEIFLFRPFDKATIWEQADVLRFAAQSGSTAMIWECMALNPRYVDILQRGWMRDDLSTLTNAYPDHEDVMGPTGMDVARAIGSFAPKGRQVITAERNMLPVLQAQAAAQQGECTGLSEAEKTLIPVELLQRFPYAEHPSNIALAARVGTTLGLERTEAIGWMAEHVIPDLGALMIYEPVDVDGRRVTFVNGHSANDELSFTHSWRHARFHEHRVATEPSKWLLGVVNNRADRVPRSRAFARLIVRVAGAHRFLVIGTNLPGFQQFVTEAIDELCAEIDLEDPQQWDRWREHLKIGNPSAWMRTLGVDESCLEALDALPACASIADARAVLTQVAIPEPLAPWATEEWTCWLALRGADTVGRRLALLRYRLASRVVPLPNAQATGDQVLAAAASLVPPGLEVQMMGMQNIKGTGLDFVYQWVRWKTLHTDLAALDADSAKRLSIKRLTCVMHCNAALAALDPSWDCEATRRAIEDHRNHLLAARTARSTENRLARSLKYWFGRFIDPFDALWRRWRSRQVLRDLAYARIDHDRAEQILADLTKRQKG